MKQDRKKPEDTERNIGLEILKGVQEIKAFKAGENELQTHEIPQSTMSQDLFDELIESIREGGAILRGEKEPARTFKIETPDVK
jgi:hypothetical protein